MTGKKTISIQDLIAQDEKEAEKREENAEEGADLRKAKEYNKFYLPALHLNDSSMWPSKPKSERKLLTDKVAKETCLLSCCGHPGIFSGCCQLDPDDMDHVIGPVEEKWVKKIIKYFAKQGIKYTRHDIVVDMDEGKLIANLHFSSREVFFAPSAYPMLRLQVNGPRFACKFLNIRTGKCTIYDLRPKLCRGYYCEYVRANFLVRTGNEPNIYKKLR